LPAVPSDRLPASPFPVFLVAPDGSELRATATVVVPHIRGPLAPVVMLRVSLPDASLVPSGTEVWLDG